MRISTRADVLAVVPPASVEHEIAVADGAGTLYELGLAMDEAGLVYEICRRSSVARHTDWNGLTHQVWRDRRWVVVRIDRSPADSRKRSLLLRVRKRDIRPGGAERTAAQASRAARAAGLPVPPEDILWALNKAWTDTQQNQGLN